MKMLISRIAVVTAAVAMGSAAYAAYPTAPVHLNTMARHGNGGGRALQNFIYAKSPERGAYIASVLMVVAGIFDIIPNFPSAVSTYRPDLRF